MVISVRPRLPYSIGRYLRVDPIGLSGGVNRHTYANQSPTNVVDFYGLMGVYHAKQVKDTVEHYLYIYKSYDEAYNVVAKRYSKLLKMEEQMALNSISGKLTDTCAKNNLSRTLNEEIARTRKDLLKLAEITGRPFLGKTITPPSLPPQ